MNSALLVRVLPALPALDAQALVECETDGRTAVWLTQPYPPGLRACRWLNGGLPD